MKELNIKVATKRYNDLMWDLGYEHNTIGTSLSEDTEDWNLRDMVSECQYVLDCCYEDGHANSEGRYTDYLKLSEEDMMSKEKIRYVMRHNDAEKKMHEHWLSMTRRLRNFIKKYEPYIKDMKCASGHCSCYDN